MAGSIPTEIGQCSQLTILSLWENQLTGSWHFAIPVGLIDGKRVYQLTEMRWQVQFRQKLVSALSWKRFGSQTINWLVRTIS